MAQAAFAWEEGRSHRLTLRVQGDRLVGAVDGATLFDVRDHETRFVGGAIALVCTEGEMEAREVKVASVE